MARLPIKVVVDEKSCAKFLKYLETMFRKELTDLVLSHEMIQTVRGKGLLNALVIAEAEERHHSHGNLTCLSLKGRMDYVAKPTHGNMIRFAPPVCH